MNEAVRKPLSHWTKPTATANGSISSAATNHTARNYQQIVKFDLQQFEKHHKELCLELNMDTEAVQTSWASYVRVSNEHTLEGDQAHWLSCALYVACRSSSTPTVAGGPDAIVEGNCVSLTHLLRCCKITFLEFFNKMQQWMEMAGSTDVFRNRVERLKNNLCVSLLVYEKFHAIFMDLFVGNQDEQRVSRKTAATMPCSPRKLYEFCWYLFVCAKSECPESAVDLVTTFHTLLCCIDLVFANVLTEKRHDLLNPNLVADSTLKAIGQLVKLNGQPKGPICIITPLCTKYDGTVIDAMFTKQYTWRSVIQKYLAENVLRSDGSDNFMGILSVDYFEQNFCGLKNVYKSYFLSVGEIDEGILLTQMENSVMHQNLERETAESKRQLMPPTPLTRRNYLPGKDVQLEPVALATRNVDRLRHILGPYDPQPPASLVELLKLCDSNPIEKIKTLLCSMSTVFCAKYEKNAIERFELAEMLYYRMLELIVRRESAKHKVLDKINQQRLAQSRHVSPYTYVGEQIVKHETFHKSLVTCCVEIVLHAYMGQKKFPWVLECFDVEAFNFYKIIEMIVLNHRDLLTRDLIKHLNAIEEKCIDCLVWRSSSPLWEQIDRCSELPERQAADQPKEPTINLNYDHLLQPHRNRGGGPFDRLLQSPADEFSTDNRLPTKIPSDHVSKQLFKPAQISPPVPSSTFDDSSSSSSPPPAGVLSPVKLFFRKFYKLAYLRMREICLHLNYLTDLYMQKIWTIFEYSITKKCQLMRDRHLDQLLMCAIYVFGRNAKFPTTFKDIMLSYRKQPQTTSDVYRDVHMNESDIEFEREATQQSKAIANHITGVISCPSGKYDIISFYNNCYVRSMQEFVINTKEDGMLSPLPSYSNQMMSPRKISKHHSLFIQPLEPKDLPSSPNSMTYSFKASPVENFGQIQRVFAAALLNSNGKRELPFARDDDATGSDGKSIRNGTKVPKKSLFKVTRHMSNSSSAITTDKSVPYLRDKLQKIITDRQGQ